MTKPKVLKPKKERKVFKVDDQEKAKVSLIEQQRKDTAELNKDVVPTVQEFLQPVPPNLRRTPEVQLRQIPGKRGLENLDVRAKVLAEEAEAYLKLYEKARSEQQKRADDSFDSWDGIISTFARIYKKGSKLGITDVLKELVRQGKEDERKEKAEEKDVQKDLKRRQKEARELVASTKENLRKNKLYKINEKGIAVPVEQEAF